jgi:hypothetical protein
MTQTEPEIDPRLSALQARMKPWDRAALLAGIAGLAMVAENANRQFRLEVLGEIAASLPPAGGNKPRARDLDRLTNGREVSQLVAMFEDPSEYPVTETVFFERHGYTVFTGQGEEPVARLGLLLRIFDRAEATTPWADRSPQSLIKAMLRLVSAVAARAGIPSGLKAIDGARVAVPGDAALETLLHAATWTKDDLDALVADLGVDSGVFAPFTLEAGTATLAGLPEDGELQRRPLVHFDSEIFVLFPGLVPLALAHALLTWAHGNGYLPQLAADFAQASARSLALDLQFPLGWFRLEAPDAATPLPPNLISMAFQMDEESAAILIVVGDPLTDFNPSTFAGSPDVDEAVADAADARVDELTAWLLDPAQAFAEVLILACPVAPPSRSYGFGVPRPGSDHLETLVLTPGALSVIAWTEIGEPRSLLRYAKSQTAQRERAEVVVFNPLDEFALFHKYGHSYYMSDDRHYTLLSITPGMGAELRQRHIDRRRMQSALLPDGRDVIVMAEYEDASAPIFVPVAPIPQATALVRLPRLDVWVFGPPGDDVSPALAWHYHHLVRAAAYWIWQAGDHILATAPQPPHPGSLVISLRLEEPSVWVNPVDLPERSANDVSWAKADEREAYIFLGPGLIEGFSGPVNQGERQMAAIIVAAILQLLGVAGDPLNPAIPIVDIIAPVGPKKMVMFLTPDLMHGIGPNDDLPRWRKVSDWEDGVILDQLAAELERRGHQPDSAGSATEQVKLVNEAVAILYGWLCDEVAELSPDGLLENLLLRLEALYRESGMHRLQIPTRIACFGEYSDITSMLRQEMHDLLQASLSHRFLVEYVASRPPTGSKPLTTARYERLLALAQAVVDYGFVSDMVQFDLAPDAEIRILPSGRLGTARGVMSRATERFQDRAIPQHVRLAQEHFGSHWRGVDAASAVGPQPEWQAAFQAEFGYSLTDLGGVAGEVANLALDGNVAVMSKPRSDVVSHVAATLGIAEAQVDHILVDLTLAPRADFLAPSGFRPEDVYPWRYNRRLSVIRRPILLRRAEDGSDELVWGTRSLTTGVAQRVSLLHDGRLEAKSAEMLDLKSKLADVKGREFVDEVERRVKALGYEARTNVTKVGTQPLIEDGRNLGDIDVLAADEHQHTIWVIECKSLGVARTPWELWSEIREFERPDDGIIAKHQRRAEWATRHVSDIVAWLGLPVGKWAVRSMVVVESDLMILHLKSLPLQTVDLADLETALRAVLPGRLPRLAAVRRPTPNGKNKRKKKSKKSGRRPRR